MTPGDRSAFPQLDARAYLNHAAIGPLPTASLTALNAANAAQAQEGAAAVGALYEAAHQVRVHAAALTGHETPDVALTGNTSQGVTAIAQSLAWSSRDRIVLFDGEFPTNTTPWQMAAQAHGAEVVWQSLRGFGDGSGDGLNRLEATLRTGVKLVAVSAVQFRSGLRMPVEAMAKLCQRHGAALFVDAIQGLGAVPMDLSDADYVASGGQKWLMGPIGTGFVSIHARRRAELGTSMASWLSHVDPLRFLFEGPGRLTYERPLQAGAPLLEGGTANLAGHVGLAVSMALQLEVGVDATFRHAQRYLDALEPALCERGFSSLRASDPLARSNIVTLVPPQGHTAAELASALGDRSVRVSTPDGALRLAPSWPNRLDEVPTVLDAFDAAMTSP